MKEFLLNRTNWFILILLAVVALGFHFWQVFSGGPNQKQSLFLAMIPIMLLSARSFLVLKKIYRF